MSVTFFERYYTPHYDDQFKGIESGRVEAIIQKITACHLATNGVLITTLLSTVENELASAVDERALKGCYKKLLMCRGELELLRRAKITLEFAKSHLENEASLQNLEKKQMELTKGYDSLARNMEDTVDHFIERYNHLCDTPIGSYPLISLGKSVVRSFVDKSCIGYLGSQFNEIPFQKDFAYLKTLKPPIPYEGIADEKERRALIENALLILGLLYKNPKLEGVYKKNLNALTSALRHKAPAYVVFPSDTEVVDVHGS